jgi:DHA1 family bicyclomycin/chloramphenicol resistance-like MFS transporter
MCVGFAIVNGLAFAGLFAYVNTSPLLFIEGYGVSKAGFAGLFAITASGVMVGSSANNWLLRLHARPKSVLDAALALVSAAGLVLLTIGVAGAGSPLIVALPVLVYVSSFGLVFPNASHEAVHPLPEIAGVASAVLMTAQMLFGALGGVIAAALYRHGSPLSIGLVMSVGSLAAAALYVFCLRPGVKE